jgi:hypothetical protein
MPQTTFTVFVDDNFHYMDDSHRYKFGEFNTAEEAVAACKTIVDEFLVTSHRPGITAADLYQNYVAFGEDPFVVPKDESLPFSAWEYAKQRCAELCRNS